LRRKDVVTLTRSEFDELKRIRERLANIVSQPVELPHPSVIFDLGDRRGNRLRIYKALVQNTQLHSEHFRQATQRSHVAILDAYLEAASRRQLLVVQSMARAMLELSGLLHEVQARSAAIVLRVDETNWESLGQSFWGTIVRARLGTSDPSLREALLAAGVAAASLKPFGVTDCIHKLSTEIGFEDVESRYATLCDAVHHNFGSRVGGVAGIRLGDQGKAGAREWVVPDGPIAIVRYEYPGASDIVDAHIARTAPGMLVDTSACVAWMNQTPTSPFPIEMTERITGDSLGGGEPTT